MEPAMDCEWIVSRPRGINAALMEFRGISRNLAEHQNRARGAIASQSARPSERSASSFDGLRRAVVAGV